MYWPPMGGIGWVGWLVGGLFMLLILGVLIALIFFLVRSRSSRQSSDTQITTEHEALEILKVRYARGELSKEEYDDMRRESAT